ncbi:phage tail assembly protein [Sphingobium yanoikuyae]|uniref:phage tail assembly protein n=1 Tax=Sphingobium yanoikuyae TaxID=13690 RepID=UPI0026F12B8A|nr:phage tail assembly protein [Sphingobium yanoikuyae]
MDAKAINTRPSYLKPDNSYDLIYPVKYKVGEQETLLETLQLRRLTGVERVIASGEGNAAVRTHAMLASVTGQMLIVIQKIDWVDLDRLDECLGFFTEHGPATGESA